MISKFKYSKSESIFLLSPFLIAWGGIFNFHDVKHILSKLIAIISVYCLILYRNEVKEKLRYKSKAYFLLFLLVVYGLYSFLYYYNDGHFDFARAVISCFFLFLLIPSRLFNRRNLFFVVSSCSVVTILSALYESYFLDVLRVGYVVNSGPYSYVYSLLLVMQCYFLFSNRDNATRLYKISGFAFNLIVVLGLLFVIYMTVTRTAWMGISLVCLFYLFKMVKDYSPKLVCISFLIGIFSLFLLSTQPKFKSRIDTTVAEANLIKLGDYTSSFGSRIDMWKNGIAFGKNSPIIGLNRKVEIQLVADSYNHNKMQKLAYKILNHSRSSYHNVFVQAWVKGGVVALVVMSILVFALPIFKVNRHYQTLIIPITILTFIASLLESQFTIYSSCTYFYLLFIGWQILSDEPWKGHGADRSQVVP